MGRFEQVREGFPDRLRFRPLRDGPTSGPGPTNKEIAIVDLAGFGSDGPARGGSDTDQHLLPRVLTPGEGPPPSTMLVRRATRRNPPAEG